MTVPKKQNDLKPTQDLDALASPEEMADLLIRTYDNPLQELSRRKTVSEENCHQENILFWQNVEAILSRST